MNIQPSANARPGEHPYLFCYDISCPKRARKVLRCLRRWRVDGQLSLHETWMRPAQVYELTAELMELVAQNEDSLLLSRLNERGLGPVWQLCGNLATSPILGYPPTRLPKIMSDGWYLLCYDIRQSATRLRRVQRATAKQCLYLQRSVYLFQGRGNDLSGLIDTVKDLMDRGEDDVRIYALSGTRDLWFLCGEKPPLAEFRAPLKSSLWQTLKRWLRR